MLRLLTLAPDGEPLRSAVPREAIPADAAHEHLVERLVQARLVTADADVLDLAHETLARAWPRLRGWLDDDLEGQRILRHLSTAAESWLAMGRPDAELYRGDRLARAGAWQAASGADLTAHEADFLARSREVADAAAAEVARVASARRRTRRRAPTLVAVATTLGIVAGLAAWVAVRERDQRRAGAAAGGLGATRLLGPPRGLALPGHRRPGRVAVARGRGGAPRRLRRHPRHPAGGAEPEPGAGAGRPRRLAISWRAQTALACSFSATSPRVVDTTSFATVATGDDAFAQFLAEPGLVTWA